jgi:hypothetical protein
MPNGMYANAVSTSTWFGTNANQTLQPLVTCDPRKRASGTYFNPNCFTVPAYGQQGTLNFPYLHQPAYFDSDLALYKNFNISERQRIQFRISATNWLNHPLPQFNLTGNNSDDSLNFTQPGTFSESNQAECNLLISHAAGSNVTTPCTINTVGLSTVNTNPTTTGKPAFKTGSRSLLFALKYYF